ncbi:hypothetical protein RclHR1_20350001 [Rhizophagus clarus]|nr:hypothetical protein RclHR1_20350001 [Rhizophagus clarus]
MFWQELINEHKENQVPVASHSNSKKIDKIPVEISSNTSQSYFQNKTKKNINTIDFCCDVLHELENKFNTNSFYKLTSKIIESPMDLFTINSKLDNEQYTNVKEFESDIRLMFRNCYIYNNRGSKIHQLGKELELIFNEIWFDKIINQGKELRNIQDNDVINSIASKTEVLTEKNITQAEQKVKLKRVRDDGDHINLSTNHMAKQIRILEQNKDDLVYIDVVNNALLIASSYKSLVTGSITPFIKTLKTFLLSRSQMSLYSADKSVLQAIVESLLPRKYRIPELSLVMDVSLMKNIKDKYGANDLENLDKFLEKEDEKLLLKRLYSYWSKEHNITKQITIGEMLENGINQLTSYMKWKAHRLF